jgi:hypothetical protein
MAVEIHLAAKAIHFTAIQIRFGTFEIGIAAPEIDFMGKPIDSGVRQVGVIARSVSPVKFKGSRVNFCCKIVAQAIFRRSAKEAGVISVLN